MCTNKITYRNNILVSCQTYQLLYPTQDHQQGSQKTLPNKTVSTRSHYTPTHRRNTSLLGITQFPLTFQSTRQDGQYHHLKCFHHLQQIMTVFFQQLKSPSLALSGYQLNNLFTRLTQVDPANKDRRTWNIPNPILSTASSTVYTSGSSPVVKG